ncbi:hypothetical protein KQI76_01240 [Amphibacillus sp. MSJ-3]|uniref:pectinesterase family protein n=1 Tax=Amphibacillus sp. MSJ-3 TaxID=2841505 RepID=UPI001C0ED0C8|nr:pectinesterase family protein [Amphibacillus sp. MSJ-3]MBU5593781.1 hypothetical protein [Amphibacillus sp. MSJ-3]
MRKLRKTLAIVLSLFLLLSSTNIVVLADNNSKAEESDRVYLVDDDFEDKELDTAVEDFPESDNYSVLDAWNKDGTIKSIPRVVKDPLDENGNVIFVEDLGDTAVAVVKDIPRQEKPFTVELDFMAEEFGHSTKVLRTLDGSTVAAEIELRNIGGKNILGYSIPGGHEILDDDFQLNTWYNIKLLVDPENQQATPVINDVVMPTYGWRFLNATGITRVLTMAPGGQATSSYFDNLKVYEGIDDSLLNPDTPPSKIEDIDVSTDELSVFLDWDPVEGAKSYTVKMATDPEGPFEPIVGATDQVLTYAKVDVLSDGTYYFLVEANNAKGSTASDVYSVDVKDDTERILAFPGAEGGGKYTTGGRGQEVYTVTTLEDYGPGEEPIEGSLRHALSKGNRTITFDVSGTIYLKDGLSIKAKNITIAGQTAPGDGITLANYDLDIGGSENIIIRYIRIRPGVTNSYDEPDGIGGVDAKDIILDHISTSWSTDETLSIYRSENITVQNSIISESLTMGAHVKGKHGYGGIFGGKNATYFNNIIASHTNRNPRIGGSTPGQTNVDFNNNIIYNWESNSIYGGNYSDVNIVNNYMKPGPGTYNNVKNRIVNPGIFGSPSSWYVSGNYMFGDSGVTADNSKGIHNKAADATIRTEPIPFPENRLREPQSAEDAYQDILKRAGANFPRRDAVDARIVADIVNGTGRFINSEEEVGGYPELASLPAPLDSDGDGIPDDWETANGLDPKDPSDGNEVTEEGYTNLELYINSLVDIDYEADNPVAEITSPTLNSIHEAGKDLEIKTKVESSHGIEKVEFYTGSEKLGETKTAPYQYTWKDAPDGTHFVSIKVTDKQGNQTQSTSAPIHVNSPLNSETWQSTDIGNVGIAGNTSVDEEGVITVKGSGRITGKNDAFHFGYQELKGDGEFIAKINSITPVDNNAIAGIAIRSSLEKDAATAILSTSLIKADRIESKTPYTINLSSRLADGEKIETLDNISYPDEKLPSLLSTEIPYWLKLVRDGNEVTGYASPDGETWTKVGEKTIDFDENVYVGFAVDAAKNTNEIDNYNTAVFSDISTTMAKVDDIDEPEEPKEEHIIFEDDFSKATGDNITTPEYMSLPDDRLKPMYISRAGKLEVVSNQLNMSGRFTIGARDAVDTSEDFTPGGVFDLSKPYRMTIKIADTILDSNNEGRRLQVFVDNGTSIDEKSIHGSDSKIFQQTVSSITPGEIIIESDVGTEESFVQIRTEGDSGVVIDQIKIEAIESDDGSEEPEEPAEPEIPREPGEDDVIVAKDGSGDYETVQEAIDAIPNNNNEPVTIFVKNGVYKEVVTVPKDKPFVTIIGETQSGTIITYDNYAGRDDGTGGTYGTTGSSSVFLRADHFRAENLTFENGFDPSRDVEGKQAVAVYATGEKMYFKNVSFLGHQDTLYVRSGSQYFNEVYVEGDVDFIFGAARSVFEDSIIHSLDRGSSTNNGYITAASTSIKDDFGILILNSKLTSDAAPGTVYLGRPWQAGGDPENVASVVFKESELGAHIHKDGWTSMSGFEPEDARLYEYKNYGPGAVVNDSRRQLTDEEAEEWTVENVLGWDPKEVFPEEPGDPEDPEEPGEPGDPEEPGEPGDPEDPGEPGEPGDPEEPGEPGDPGDPEEPGEPGDPEEPGDPSDPEDPSEPGDPEEPGEPGDPEEPGEPGDPEDPGEPGDPEEPGEPGDPEEPGDQNKLLPGTSTSIYNLLSVGLLALLFGGSLVITQRKYLGKQTRNK